MESFLLRLEGVSHGNLQGMQKGAYGVYTGDSRQHWDYTKIIKCLPFLADWGVITTVRHPYERARSEFRYQVSEGQAPKDTDINEWIQNGKIWSKAYDYHGMPQAAYLGPDPILLRHESLDSDFRAYFGETLPYHHLKTKRTERDELDDKSKRLIFNKWGVDFDTLGYAP